MAKIRKTGESVNINAIRTQIRKEIEKRYGGVAKFLKTPECEKFGGKKIRCYLYDTGAINYEIISALAKFLGIGELKRELVVTRTYSYRLIKCNAEETK